MAPPEAQPAAGGPEPAAADRPAPTPKPRRRPSGVSVVVGGLLQDLEDRMRRNLAPIEERVRPGAETRGLAGDPADDAADPLVIVLPGAAVDADPA